MADCDRLAAAGLVPETPTPRRAVRAQRKEPCHVDSHRPRSRAGTERMSLLRALTTRGISSREGRVSAGASASSGPQALVIQGRRLFLHARSSRAQDQGQRAPAASAPAPQEAP